MSSRVIEADERGTVHLSSEMTGAKPHEHFHVEVQAGTLVLRPLISYPPNWDMTTPAQRAAEFLEMVREFEAMPGGPSLSDDALRRENLYD